MAELVAKALAAAISPRRSVLRNVSPVRNVVKSVFGNQRLPARFAQELYDAGESGMGYVGYEIEFTDGTRQAYLTGNGLDFVELPQGKGVGDIVKAWPHEGLRNAPRQTPDFVWCLYGKK